MNSYTENNDTCQSCEFDDNLGILREIPFFSGLPLEALKVLAYLCTRETFKPDEMLFSQDDDDGRAIYILSGKAILMRRTDAGDLEIRAFGKGDFLGSLVLLGNMRRLFSLKASTDMVCVVLARKKFNKVMAQFPELTPKIFKSLIEGLRVWEERFLSGFDEYCESCRHKIGVSLV